MVTFLAILVFTSIALDLYAAGKVMTDFDEMKQKIDQQEERIDELEQALVEAGIGYFEEEEINHDCHECSCDCTITDECPEDKE